MFKNAATMFVVAIVSLNLCAISFGDLIGIPVPVPAPAPGGVDCTDAGHATCRSRGGSYPPTCVSNPEPCELKPNHDPKWVRCYCDDHDEELNECICWKSTT